MSKCGESGRDSIVCEKERKYDHRQFDEGLPLCPEDEGAETLDSNVQNISVGWWHSLR